MKTVPRHSAQDAVLLAILSRPRCAFWMFLGLALAIASLSAVAFFLGASFLVCQIGLNGGALLAAATMCFPKPSEHDIGGVAQVLLAGGVLLAATAVDLLMAANRFPVDCAIPALFIWFCVAFSALGFLGAIVYRATCRADMLVRPTCLRPTQRRTELGE